ncbi:MAG: dockerin type I repeat-containing protein [Kiritimatiellae bacterium]|nr:dockerin type I repeat-containing protein [Kiritimatiellia bacterium]
MEIRTESGFSGSHGDIPLPEWRITGTTGYLTYGAKTVATLVFDALDVTEDSIALVEIESAGAESSEGLDAIVRKASPIVITIRNNPAFDPVHATFLPGTASAKIGTEAALPVSVQIDASLNGAAWSLTGTYDAALLDVLGATATAAGMSVECSAADGAFTVRGTGGTLAAKTAAQQLFSMTVRPKEQYETRQTLVAFTNAAATAVDGRVFEAIIGNGGAVGIHFTDTDTPPEISYPDISAEGWERREISVPVRLTTSQALDRRQLALQGTYDEDRLVLLRIEAADGFLTSASASGAWRIEGTAGVVPAGAATLGTLVFHANDVIADTLTQVTVDGGSAVSADGVAAPLVPSASFGVLVRNDPAFDPIHATFSIDSASAEIESVATVKASATFDQPMDGATMFARIAYDAALVSVENVEPHVSGFTLSWAASGGVLTITGIGGTIPVPAASVKLDLFKIYFRLAKQQTTHSTDISFAESPVASSTDGRTYIVDSATGGSIAITWTEKPRYIKGDVNGDGELNGDDVRFMQQMIRQGARPTASELAAGDFNGDGRIDARDYQLLMSYFKELGISNR